ncbi:MAG TPA: hypothetical protein VF815_06700 [Myxococcaceae bacterium]|jgi:hypothetical protein
MLTPLRLAVLLVGLLGACTTASPTVRHEAAFSSEKVLTGHEEWAVQPVSSGSTPEGTAPSGPRGQPLTRERLLTLALSRGIGLSPVPVQRNWEVGMAFQLTLCRSLNLIPNTGAFEVPEQSATKSVSPDGILPAVRINLQGMPTFRLDGAFLEVIGPESFLEVKAQQRPITLSTGRGQIGSFIQVLARRRPRSFVPGAMEPPRPALLLVTTADSQVAQGVPEQAGRHGVALYQAVAWENGGLLTLGPFLQRTGFADVPRSFTLPSVPEPLQLRSR